jgi:hypothetical protein
MMNTAKQATAAKSVLHNAYLSLMLHPAASKEAQKDRNDAQDIIMECERLISVEGFTRKPVTYAQVHG